jgi:type VI secretion system protein ImpM
MQAGIFGKLPAKRDFVSYGLTRPFLDGWEQWLQSGVAESRHALGEGWKDIFLTLPIWRFWLGPGLFGQAATGVIMASVDGVGRYFPLTICACAEPDECLPSATDPGLEAWLSTCEQTVLGLLDDRVAFEPPAILEALGTPPGLLVPATAPHAAQPMTFWTDGERSLEDAFAELERTDCSSLEQLRGLWWTLAGEHHAPQLISTTGPVPAALWISFMTGQVAA